MSISIKADNSLAAVMGQTKSQRIQDMDKHLVIAIAVSRTLGMSVQDLQQRIELLSQPKSHQAEIIKQAS